MALEQEVIGPGQAESGKNDKQDQVHCSLTCKLEPAKQYRPVEGTSFGAYRSRSRKSFPIVNERVAITVFQRTHRYASQRLVPIMLRMASGMRMRHPKFISWS